MGFYESCAIPKPGKAKKKKQANGYKEKADRFCFYCKTPYAERHEVYGGPNRQISISHRFQVDLCSECHREMTENITSRGKERNAYWREYFQQKFEKDLRGCGLTQRQARDLWMDLIGRNYIQEE